MSLYRVNQFCKGLTAKITSDDEKIIEENLNMAEKNLFYKMKISEQKHCIEVYKDILSNVFDNTVNKKRLLKASLLHDIGKITCPINIVEKSILVLLDKFSKGTLKKFENISKINIYYNHGYYGYELLKEIEEDKELLNLIRYHQHKAFNKELYFLNFYDDRN